MKPIFRGCRWLMPAVAGVVLAAVSTSVAAPVHAAQPPRARAAGVQVAYAAPEVAAARGRVIWRWTLTNTQAHAVSDVVLAHTFTPATGVTSVSAPCTSASSVVRCRFASLGAGEVRQGVIETVLSTVRVRVGGQVTWSEPAPPAPPAPVAPVPPVTAGQAGLWLTYGAPEVAADRGRVIWRWTLTNTQAHAVSDVVLAHTFTPAAGVTSVSAPCTSASSVVRCRFASLGAGEVRQGVIETVPPTVRVQMSGQVGWVEPTARVVRSTSTGAGTSMAPRTAA